MYLPLPRCHTPGRTNVSPRLSSLRWQHVRSIGGWCRPCELSFTLAEPRVTSGNLYVASCRTALPRQTDPHDMSENGTGKTVLITGGTSGIGKEASRQLARAGWRVVVHGRDERKGRDAVEELRAATGNGDVHLLLAALASLHSVRKGADEFRRRFGR